MAHTVEVRVPDIGDFSAVPVIEVMVNAGDPVTAEQSLITLESDKASMDVPAPHPGIVKSVQVALGDEVSEGDLILTLEIDNDSEGCEPEPVAESVMRSTPGTDIEVRVPDIGDFSDVPVIEVMVATGDRVGIDEPLITLESDKASMDVPAPAAGTVASLAVSVGDSLSEGDLILMLTTSAETPTASVTPVEPEAAAQPEVAHQPPAPPADAPAVSATRTAPTAKLGDQAAKSAKPSHATPSVRRFARELGVDLANVVGTGRKGRIIEEDVRRFVKEALSRGPAAGDDFSLPPMPEIDFSKFGDIEIRALSRIKKLSGANLHRAWLNVPHVTQHDEADITELEAFRKSEGERAKQQGVKLTPLAFIMKACIAALKTYPSFNASLDTSGENLILKHYYHLGVAVDTADGLMVPVVRDVDGKGVLELARELGTLSEKARDKKLSPNDLQGASFTISSLGGIGGTGFTPIVNAPEVAILGVSRSSYKPVFVDGEFVPRLMLPVSLSYDHRVIDGAAAARFTRYLCDVLSDVRKLLL